VGDGDGPAPAGRPIGALVLTDVHKTYVGPPPVHAVAGIDLEVTRGELFGLLGPNGAGKSTTVGLCTTRIAATAGSIRVAGIDAADAPARVKRRIGVVTQDNTLDRTLTLRENLYYHGRYFGWPRRTAADRAHELLVRFRLLDRATAFPEEISGGMAQRLQVARAIAHGPELLFLDEPTAGLDPQSRIALWELVEELRGDGLTVVLTTHYMEEADQLCDRVAIVDHGRVLVCDTPERLKATSGRGAVVDVSLVKPVPDEVVTALDALEVVSSVERSDSGVRVVVTDNEAVLAHLVELTAPLGLRDLSSSGATLEAVFVDLTGRDLRE
jgi:ABC-2 type transport system ATP-binding protein